MIKTFDNKEAVKLLERHFDIALETPDGIRKLRALILAFAVHGKLTSNKELKSVFLGDIIELISGQHLLAHEQNTTGKGIPYLTGPADFGIIFPTPTRWTESPKVIAEPGDVLLTVKGAGVGKTNRLLSEKMAISRQLMAVRAKNADIDFIHLVLQNSAEHFQSTMTGIAIPGIGRKDVLSLKVMLPPLAEQKRIVAKIDSLMSLCDKLEAQRNERNNKRLKIHTAATTNLLSSKDESDFNKSWHFITKNFNDLYSMFKNVAELKKTILQLAVMGKLVPQDPKDQPASELLKEIDAEKKRLVTAGKIKTYEPILTIKSNAIPYELPHSWVWTKLANLSEYIQRGKGPQYSETREIPVISQKSIQWSGFNKDVVKFIDPASIGQYQNERFIREGDLLWNSTGTGTIGRINIYANELNEYAQVVADSHVTIVRTIGVNKEYILNFLMSPFVQNDLEANASGTTNQIELNTTMVKNQLIPLPPLAEQKRIVAKIDQLFGLCDSLEHSLHAATTKQTAILNAVLSQI